MKRRIGIIIMIMMLLLSTTVMGAERQITALEAGFTDIPFSNDYKGFCLDQKLSGAAVGDSFTDKGGAAAKSNIDDSDVSQTIKVMFTQQFDSIFTLENGEYVINDTSLVQAAIWNLTDNYYIWGAQKTLLENAKAYQGQTIPDSGYQKTLNNGDVITFDFTVMAPAKDGQQEFFAYKLAVSTVDGHEHLYDNEWTTDDKQHWKECSCGEKADAANHEGEVRDRVEAEEYKDGYTGDTYCRICDKLLAEGRIIPATHEHNFGGKWITDDEQHWKECACGEKAYAADHEGELRDAVEPTTEKPGYTGDLYCLGCETIIEEGKEIPKKDIVTSPENTDENKSENTDATETPEKPETAKTPETAEKPESPETGDDTNLMIWVILMTIACIGMTGTALYREKRN